MARIRTIKPRFWDDIKIGKLTRDARLLYIGLWTFADDMGFVIGESIWLKSKVFPYDRIQVQQFEKWLSELARLGFICQFEYEKQNFIYLPNFARHQVINRPNVEDLNIPKDVADSKIRQFTEQSLINHGTISAREDKDKDIKETTTKVVAKKSESKTAALAATNERKQEFYESLVPFVDKYGKEMIREFFNYWSEMNKSKTKMRFEGEKTWETNLRLSTWERRKNAIGKRETKPAKPVEQTGYGEY